MARKKGKKRGVTTVPVGRNRVSGGTPVKTKRGRWVVPSRPPPGTYDPNIDVQERAAKRQYGYTIDDIATARTRASDDYQFGLGDIDIERGEVKRQYDESLADLLTNRKQAKEDYDTNLQTIARNFQRLGNTQAQAGRQRGLAGGFAAQAARKRAGNEALERAPVDLGFKRFVEGSDLAQRRLGEAKARGEDALTRAGGRLGVEYNRVTGEGGDLDVEGTRAGTEFQAYLRDAADARQAQFGGPLQKTWVSGATKPQAQKNRAAFRTFQRRQQAGANAALRRARRRGRI